MPVTYGYYIYLNTWKDKEVPSLRCDGFLTAKSGDITTILKWNGGDSVEDTKERLCFDIKYCLNIAKPENLEKYKKWGTDIYNFSTENYKNLLEFGKITFDPETRECKAEATCTTK